MAHIAVSMRYREIMHEVFDGTVATNLRKRYQNRQDKRVISTRFDHADAFHGYDYTRMRSIDCQISVGLSDW